MTLKPAAEMMRLADRKSREAEYSSMGSKPDESATPQREATRMRAVDARWGRAEWRYRNGV
jgi:hypothetical protein